MPNTERAQIENALDPGLVPCAPRQRRPFEKSQEKQHDQDCGKRADSNPAEHDSSLRHAPAAHPCGITVNLLLCLVAKHQCQN